jgi:hypothetical protein
VRNFKQASVRKSRLYTCLYHNLKDAVQLLNPEDEVSHEECFGESSVSEVEAECEPQALDVHLIEQEDETQIAANTPNHLQARFFEPSIPRRKHPNQQQDR